MSKPFKAVALKYDEIDPPKVTAKGEDDVAAAIMQLARDCGVPLYENRELVEMLSTLEIGEQIPELLYRVIAEIIAFAYFIQGKTPSNFDKGNIDLRDCGKPNAP